MAEESDNSDVGITEDCFGDGDAGVNTPHTPASGRGGSRSIRSSEETPSARTSLGKRSFKSSGVQEQVPVSIEKKAKAGRRNRKSCQDEDKENQPCGPVIPDEAHVAGDEG